MRTLERGFGKQTAVVGYDADWMAVDVREPGDQRAAVFGFEFRKFAAINEPGDDVVHVVGNPGIDRDHVVELGLIRNRIYGRAHIPGAWFARPQGRDDSPDNAQRVAV